MSNFPNNLSTGLYFGKINHSDWFNAVIYVHGNSPFFKMDVWEFTSGKLMVDYEPWRVKEFGQRITSPEDAPITQSGVPLDIQIASLKAELETERELRKSAEKDYKDLIYAVDHLTFSPETLSQKPINLHVLTEANRLAFNLVNVTRWNEIKFAKQKQKNSKNESQG